jgi:hypothetical protein
LEKLSSRRKLSPWGMWNFSTLDVFF